MASSFQLSVLTPERTFFEGAVEMLILHSTDGEIGILPNHAPEVITIVESELRFLIDGKWRWAAASSGFATVTQDQVLVMLQTAEWPEDIDIKRAERDEYEAKERLRQQKSMEEYRMAHSMLARAMVRLRVSNRHNYNN